MGRNIKTWTIGGENCFSSGLPFLSEINLSQETRGKREANVFRLGRKATRVVLTTVVFVLKLGAE
ncbi:MAG: hypothetical protein HC907_28570 [Richelia sp. SM1_7_0]|nr:hypothetical protein [Richelia sp. SM1_7_0]